MRRDKQKTSREREADRQTDRQTEFGHAYYSSATLPSLCPKVNLKFGRQTFEKSFEI